MSDPMAEIRASFFIECDELLESLFDALQAMSDGSSDTETINVAFRAVHSIKGGAGAFALDALVEFAHHFETVMDDLRGGLLDLDNDLINLFFRCGDLLSDLVRTAREGTENNQNAVMPVVEELLARSGAHSGTDEASESIASAPDFQPMALNFEDLDLGPPLSSLETSEFSAVKLDREAKRNDTKAPGLLITFKPEPELYESGNEPLYLLRSLADLGPCTIEAGFSRQTELKDFIPGAIGLLWKINVETAAPKSAVEEVFEFVSGLCVLDIEPLGQESDSTVELLTVDTNSTIAEEPQPASEISANLAPAERSKELQTTSAHEAWEARTQTEGTTGAAPTNATVRVDLGRIDRLVNLVGELVINQAMLSQSTIEAGISSNSSVSNGLDEFLQLTRDIQESVMMIRAQPVKSLFQRMSRIVREASAALEKKVVLVTDGETTEIDKTVIERLADPLTHMIRNAVDHGLETTEERRRIGKDDVGKILLTASHRSGRVIIEITDDGRGIDRNKVTQIATKKGLIPADAQLSDSETDHLLFLPGFSTADQISNLSGRGVGMDVVKNAITSLGGRISIQSEPGKGSKFSISLPLTLAVLDGMVVSVANETLVMPLNAIAETLTLTADEIRPVGASASVVLVRNEFVPLVDLGVVLGYRSSLEDYSGTIALLVSQDEGCKAALVVDAIDDQRQVVIKGLQESYGRVSGVAAATILGDGQIALILDPSDLVQNAVGTSQKSMMMEVN